MSAVERHFTEARLIAEHINSTAPNQSNKGYSQIICEFAKTIFAGLAIGVTAGGLSTLAMATPYAVLIGLGAFTLVELITALYQIRMTKNNTELPLPTHQKIEHSKKTDSSSAYSATHAITVVTVQKSTVAAVSVVVPPKATAPTMFTANGTEIIGTATRAELEDTIAQSTLSATGSSTTAIAKDSGSTSGTMGASMLKAVITKSNETRAFLAKQTEAQEKLLNAEKEKLAKLNEKRINIEKLITPLETQIASLRREAANTSTSLSSIETQITAVIKRLDAYKKHQDSYKTEYQTEIEKLTKEIPVLEQEKVKLTEKKKLLLEKIKQIKPQLKTEQERLKAIKTEILKIR
jgi:hypothetical protein